MTNISDTLLKKLNEVFSPTQALYMGIYLSAVSFTEYAGGFRIADKELFSHGMAYYLKRWIVPRETRVNAGPHKSEKAAVVAIASNNISNLADALAHFEVLLDRICILNSPKIFATVNNCRSILNHAITTTASLNFIISDMIEIERGTSGLSTTPDCICRLAATVLPRQNYDHIIEFCTGVSLFSVKLMRYLCPKMPAVPAERMSYSGQELDSQLSAISELLLLLNGFSPVEIQNTDALSFMAEGTAKKSSLILADIVMQENFVYSISPGDRRFDAYDKPALYYDWALILNILSLLDVRGNACVIVTKGALVRKKERSLREFVTRQHQLKAVITLPASLYPASALGAELLLLCGKNEASTYEQETLFMDLSQYASRKNRYQNELSEDILKQLEQADRHEESSESFSIYVTEKEIAKNDYSWNPIKYLRKEVDAETGIPLSEVADITRGLQIDLKKLTAYTEDKSCFFINIKDLKNGQISYESCSRIEYNEKWIGKYDIREDDILITAKGSALKIAIVGSNWHPSFISSNLSRIRADREKYHPYLIYEFLNSPEGRRTLERIQSGTTIRVLNPSSVKSIRLPAIEPASSMRYGEALKKNREDFDRSINSLTRQYEHHRQNILSKIQIR